MTLRINQKWVLAKRPTGEPTEDCFRLEEESVGEISEGEILVEIKYLSLDPYMRGRMSAAKSYVEPVEVGEVMEGGVVGACSLSYRCMEGGGRC